MDVHNWITFFIYKVFQKPRFLGGVLPLLWVVFASSGHILFTWSLSVSLSVREQCHLNWDGGGVQAGHSRAPLPQREKVDHVSTSAPNIWYDIKSVHWIWMDAFLCLQYFFHWDLKMKYLKVKECFSFWSRKHNLTETDTMLSFLLSS